MSTSNLNIEDVLHGENMAVWVPEDENKSAKTVKNAVWKSIFAAIITLFCW